MILDIGLITLGIIVIATGYNRGALATIFSIVGISVVESEALHWLIGIPLIGKV